MTDGDSYAMEQYRDAQVVRVLVKEASEGERMLALAKASRPSAHKVQWRQPNVPSEVIDKLGRRTALTVTLLGGTAWFADCQARNEEGCGCEPQKARRMDRQLAKSKKRAYRSRPIRTAGDECSPAMGRGGPGDTGSTACVSSAIDTMVLWSSCATE